MDPSWLSLDDLIEKTVQFLSTDLVNHKVMVSFHKNSGGLDILGDARQIEQVIRNLLLNSAQACQMAARSRSMLHLTVSARTYALQYTTLV